jgi:signal transduction histidine kinase
MLRDLIGDRSADSDTLLELVTLAHSSADYLTNLVQSILDVARLEQNTVSLDCESWSLADSVEYAIKSVFSLAISANLEVATDIPDDLPTVWIDDEKIRRVLINLLDNAVRYTPQDGRVLVSGRYDADQDVVIVCVSDTGPGIPREARHRIFDKFTQLDQRAIRGHKGSGLGLAFCRLVVEAHGGRIWVDDAEGGGAAFCFTLPLMPPDVDLLDEL